MRQNFGAKPYVYPMPVLIVGTYDENGVPNAMNAAWGCITDMSKIKVLSLVVTPFEIQSRTMR